MQIKNSVNFFKLIIKALQTKLNDVVRIKMNISFANITSISEYKKLGSTVNS